MGRFKKLLFTFIIFGGGLLIGSVIVANADFGGKQPGTAQDPLVTKSYVDEAIEASLHNGSKNSTAGNSESSDQLKVIQLKPGFAIYGVVGTEFIVRNGKTVVISNSVNGIPDVTVGKDVLDGEIIDNNHLLINAGEGRGIRPHEDVTGTIYVLVRGTFSLVQQK